MIVTCLTDPLLGLFNFIIPALVQLERVKPCNLLLRVAGPSFNLVQGSCKGLPLAISIHHQVHTNV